jgi:pyruvyl transferase EpsO
VEARALVRELSGEIESTLRPLLAGVRKVALLDYPNFPNVGDSAIWLGQIAWLRSLGLRPVYSADRRLYSEERLRRCVGDGTIIFSGGGNLGDLWEDHQRFREAVVAARLRRPPRPDPAAARPQELRARQRCLSR